MERQDEPGQHAPAPEPFPADPRVWVLEPTGYGRYGVLGVYATAETAFARRLGPCRPDATCAEYRQGELDSALDPGGLRLHRLRVQR